MNIFEDRKTVCSVYGYSEATGSSSYFITGCHFSPKEKSSRGPRMLFKDAYNKKLHPLYQYVIISLIMNDSDISEIKRAAEKWVHDAALCGSDNNKSEAEFTLKLITSIEKHPHW